MSTRKNDDRLEAFNAIVSLLSKFDDETQRHVTCPQGWNQSLK